MKFLRHIRDYKILFRRTYASRRSMYLDRFKKNIYTKTNNTNNLDKTYLKTI